jgi:hypothetical protein
MSASPEPSDAAPSGTPGISPLWVLPGLVAVIVALVLLAEYVPDIGRPAGVRRTSETRPAKGRGSSRDAVGRGAWGAPRATPASVSDHSTAARSAAPRPRSRGLSSTPTESQGGPARSPTGSPPPTAGPSTSLGAASHGTGSSEGSSGSSGATKGGGAGSDVALAGLAGKTVTVAICVETGLRANPYCPTVVQKTFPADAVPDVCTRHTAPEDAQTVTVTICTQTGLLANPFCPDVTTKTVPKDAVPGVCTVHGPTEAAATVTVTVCAQTGMLATEFCPETRQATFARDAVPGRCTVHTGP